jgi:hypothetical protein
VLFKWGIRLMQTANLDAPRRAGLIRYRPRSMSLLRIGHEFTRIADSYRLELQAGPAARTELREHHAKV